VRSLRDSCPAKSPRSARLVPASSSLGEQYLDSVALCSELRSRQACEHDDALTDDKRALLDTVAALTLAADEAFPEIRKLYESDDRLHVPDKVFNADRKVQEPLLP
jgi:hypothetical protein